jgi:hypothetical protein
MHSDRRVGIRRLLTHGFVIMDLGHCLVAVHSSSALNPQQAGTLNWGLMLPGIGPTHWPVPCFPARVGPIPCADRLFRVLAKIKIAAHEKCLCSCWPFVPSASRSISQHGHHTSSLSRLSELLRDDLARVEIPTGVHGGEESVDHVHARSGDVLLQPRCMLGADGVVVRERAA